MSKEKYYISEEVVYFKGEKGILAFSPPIPAWVWVNDDSKKALDGIKNGQSIEDLSRNFSQESSISFDDTKQSLVEFLDTCPIVTKHKIKESTKKSSDFSKLDQVWLCPSGWCNLSCCYCAVDPPSSKQIQKSLQFWIDVVKQCINLGAKDFVFSGGEPTLYEKLVDLIVWINDNTSSGIQLLTNGILLSDKDIIILSKTRVQIQISLDGTKPETNDPIRGKGSFAKIVAVVKKFIDNGKKIDISMTVCKINISDVDKMPEFVKELGIIGLRMAPYFDTGRAATDDKNSFSDEERVSLILKILNIMRKSTIKISCGAGNLETPSIGDSNNLCGAGNGLIAINFDGGVYACTDAIQIAGSCAGYIDKEPLQQIMTCNLFNQNRSATLYDIEDCRICIFRKLCGGGCPMERTFLKSIGLTFDKECKLYKTVLEKIMLEEVI